MKHFPSAFTKEDFQEFFEFLRSHEVPTILFKKKTTYSISMLKYEINLEKKFEYAWPKLKSSSKAKTEEIEKELESLKKTRGIFNAYQPRTQILLWDDFQTFELSKVYGDESKFPIERKAGQLLLLMFWKITYIIL